MYAGWVGTGRKLGWGRDFTKDFSMSTKISGFRERLRKISKVYEISVRFRFRFRTPNSACAHPKSENDHVPIHESVCQIIIASHNRVRAKDNARPPHATEQLYKAEFTIIIAVLSWFV